MPEFEVLHQKSPVFYDTYERKSELQHQTHYCPGCGHGVAHKLIAEAIADLGLQDRTIFVSPVGCSVFAYFYFDTGNVQASHGRTPAVATALKRSLPESIVIGYQGDGDLAAIGTAEILHAANRGEKITVFFVNNAIYGMTGGQMAPTTLVGQFSTTSPWGRRPENEGFPVRMSELLATLEAPVYIERVALSDNKHIMTARRAIRKALELQMNGAGFSFVEILSPCPTIWKLDAVAAQKWVAEQMIPVFPPGVYRDRKAPVFEVKNPPHRELAELLELTPKNIERTAETSGRVNRRVNHSIKIAGMGGQGVLLLGQFLVEAGMREGLEVSWLPSYGPEMRSGSAHCHVRLANERIGSPLVSRPDVVIAMNEISLRKFGPHVAEGGTVFYNGRSIPERFSLPNQHLVCIPASDIADMLGSAKVANFVMMGALLESTGLQWRDRVVEILQTRLKNAALLEMNGRALDAGRDVLREQMGTGGVAEKITQNVPSP
ncbi:MAG: 2-oxoacid:acceptor oxidoreductase family protein [Acidobacteria bacterium]|nr:2-oxoacid:acceptor oxidoreductase family protein [Acidobacteriota bacterium]